MRYKNAFWLFLAEGYTAFATAVAGLLTARLLPIADFGAFSASFAFAQILSVLVDSGMGAFVGKQIGRDPSNAMAEINYIFTWRLATALVYIFLSPLLAHFFLPTVKMREMALILTPSLILLTTTDFVSWIFKGLQRVHWCVVLQVVSRTLLVVLSLTALVVGRSLPLLLVAYGVAGTFATAFALFVLAKIKHSIRIVPLPRTFFKNVLPNLYKLGAILMLNVIFSRMDIMLVAKYCGSFDTGVYSGAVRVIDGLRMMPTVALGVCLPMFAALHDQPNQLRSKFMSVYMFLLALATALALAGSAFAEPIFTHLLGPSYSASVPLFRPLVWSCLLVYCNMLMFALLYAVNDHRTPALAAVVALVIDLACNVILLPRFGVIAASWSRLAAEGCICVLQARGLLRAGIISIEDFVVKPGLVVGGAVVLAVLLRRASFSSGWATTASSVILMVAGLWPVFNKQPRPSCARAIIDLKEY